MLKQVIPEPVPQKRIGLWLRVSTQMQAEDSDSLDHHKLRGEAYATAKGWNIVETYSLEGVSGKAVLDHPEGKRMIADIKRGHISGLVFSKLARLARSTKELLEISDIFQSYDASLISLEESIDTSTPAGHLFFTIISAMAEWERKEISSRIKASIPIRAKLGKPLGGNNPYGYTWNKDKSQMILDETEAPIRKLMFELYIEHKRFKTVANILNERGYRARDNKLFTGGTIQILITDTIAKGVKVSNRRNVKGHKDKYKPESEWIYTKVPAIVSEEIFDTANTIYRSNKKTQNPIARKPKHILAGKLVCGKCDGNEKMYVPSNSPKYTCRKCRNKIDKEDIEDIFAEHLKSFLTSPEELNKYLENADSVIVDKTEALESLTNELQSVKDKKAKIYELFMAGGITVEEFKRENEPLEERLLSASEHIPELKSEIIELKEKYLSSETYSNASSLYDSYVSMDNDTKHKIIESVLDQIIINEEEIDIKLHYIPSSEIDGNLGDHANARLCLRRYAPKKIATHRLKTTFLVFTQFIEQFFIRH